MLLLSICCCPEHQSRLGHRPTKASSVCLAAIDMPQRLVVEYAKSARAACKVCGTTMAKGSVRLGSITNAEAGFDVTRWHHPSCFLKSLFDGGTLDLDEINGFKSLKAVDQVDLKKMAAGFENVCTETPLKRMKTDGVVGESSNEDALKKILDTFSHSQLALKYKEAVLRDIWRSYLTLIIGQSDDLKAREKIAAFDFDGCLVKTSVHRHGADAWSLFNPTIPKRLREYYHDGYKLVIFTNESNIERWKNSRQKAVDSKIGRLEGFMQLVKVPMQVFIACGREGTGDLFRKPKYGMWAFMERHFNEGISIEKERSFYVGDAAGRLGDHSDADIGFAKAIGLKFLLPEDVFIEANENKS